MQLDTGRVKAALAFGTNITMGSTQTDRSTPQAFQFDSTSQNVTMPLAPTGVANEIAVLDSYPNQVVVQVVSTGSTAVDVRVVGWRRCDAIKAWVPMLLCEATATLHTGTSATINGTASMFATISYVVNQGTANTRVVSGTSYKAPASLLIDAQGCEYVEVGLTCASASVANAFVSGV